ncbi:MAG: hypothetical protein ACREMB_00705 [Candidatus Rokuibacteriota bacterium]
MNPRIPADYDEVARWIENFAASHAKRVHLRIAPTLETGDEREGRSYGLRLVLNGVTRPAAGRPPLEFGYTDVAAGRTRFAWCEALAQRFRDEARQLVVDARESRTA